MKKSEWDKLRKEAYKKSDGHCLICNEPSELLEAHERWDFNEDIHIQKLIDIIGICPKCHSVIHIGRTQMLGYEQQAKEHFMKINNADLLDYANATLEAKTIYERKSKIYDWSLDVSWLEARGIAVDK
jgi:hypothetical protein